MCGLEPDSSGLRNLHPVPALGGVFALPQLTANTLLPRRQILESQTTLSSLMRKRLTSHLRGWLQDPRVCIPPKLTTPPFYFSSTYCKTLYSLVFCFILGMYSLLWLLNFILLKDIIHQKKSCVLCTWFYFHLTYYFFMITDTIYLCNRWWWWPGPCSTVLWFV